MTVDPNVPNHVNWGDPTLQTIVGVWLMGSIAKVLVSSEPFDPKKFAGELILACIGGFICYLTGVLRGEDPLHILLFGVLASLGGVRLLEWVIKIVRKVHEMR